MVVEYGIPKVVEDESSDGAVVVLFCRAERSRASVSFTYSHVCQLPFPFKESKRQRRRRVGRVCSRFDSVRMTKVFVGGRAAPSDLRRINEGTRHKSCDQIWTLHVKRLPQHACEILCSFV